MPSTILKSFVNFAYAKIARTMVTHVSALPIRKVALSVRPGFFLCGFGACFLFINSFFFISFNALHVSVHIVPFCSMTKRFCFHSTMKIQ